jgi:cyclophilin family peptidyl-prolyl cis-trans isomerase
MKKVVPAVIVGVIVIIGVGLVLGNSQTGKNVPANNNGNSVPAVRGEQATAAPTPAAVNETPTMIQTKPKTYTHQPAMTIDVNKSYTAVIKTSKGILTVPLFARETPVTVNNFVFLSRDGFYDNTVFHRIIKGFMIQGGDPQGNGTGGPGYQFNDEKITRGYTRGTLAMANAGPNTNGSQFFIMQADNPLPKNYVIFGAIDPTDTACFSILDAIAATPVTDNGMGETSKPTQPVTVESVTITEK